MTALIALLLATVCVTGTGVVLNRTPRRQVFAIGVNGLGLALLFLVLQAPDVAYSEIVIGTVALPLFFLSALAALRGDGGRE